MKRGSRRVSDSGGMTLVEVVTVIVVVAILLVLVLGGLGKVRERAEGIKCTSNMRNLHVSLASYLSDRKNWPQCPIELGDEGYDAWWLTEMTPYGIGKETWQCPSMAAKGAANGTDSEFKMHYIPTPFDENAITPFRWSTQPWLVEIGDNHGKGNLVIFPDGSVRSLDELMPKQP